MGKSFKNGMPENEFRKQKTTKVLNKKKLVKNG